MLVRFVYFLYSLMFIVHPCLLSIHVNFSFIHVCLFLSFLGATTISCVGQACYHSSSTSTNIWKYDVPTNQLTVWATGIINAL